MDYINEKMKEKYIYFVILFDLVTFRGLANEAPAHFGGSYSIGGRKLPSLI